MYSFLIFVNILMFSETCLLRNIPLIFTGTSTNVANNKLAYIRASRVNGNYDGTTHPASGHMFSIYKQSTSAISDKRFVKNNHYMVPSPFLQQLVAKKSGFCALTFTMGLHCCWVSITCAATFICANLPINHNKMWLVCLKEKTWTEVSVHKLYSRF